ncbi:MAG: DUF4215 domain-containing protein [Deltaproteobacteria bacterium]|nr:MAG: DUF4215 domain-containing protein [Deltaproteobacteria bacterium]
MFRGGMAATATAGVPSTPGSKAIAPAPSAHTTRNPSAAATRPSPRPSPSKSDTARSATTTSGSTILRGAKQKFSPGTPSPHFTSGPVVVPVVDVVPVVAPMSGVGPVLPTEVVDTPVPDPTVVPPVVPSDGGGSSRHPTPKHKTHPRTYADRHRAVGERATGRYYHRRNAPCRHRRARALALAGDGIIREAITRIAGPPPNDGTTDRSAATPSARAIGPAMAYAWTMRHRGPAWPIALALVAAGVTAACFDGADALGLPCEVDRDCGLRQRCDDGVCVDEDAQGPPDTCGDGILHQGEACDDGNDVDDDGCTNACTLPACGDGIVQAAEGEQCDDGNTDAGDGCSETCQHESCGDGIVQPMEACDDGNDVDDDGCTNACTLPACGDGIVQAARGEECDNGKPVDDATCTAECKRVWFFDDAEDSQMFDAWSIETFPEGADPMTTWKRVQNPADAHAGMGFYHLPPQPGMVSVGAGVRLVSPPIDLTDVGDGGVELRFFHKYAFDRCDSCATGDGAVLQVSVDGGEWDNLTPYGFYPGAIGEGCNSSIVNPLGGASAFVGEQLSWAEVRADLAAYAGSSIRIALAAGFDALNCEKNIPLVWYLDDIVVARPK